MAAFRVSSLCPSGPSRKEGSELWFAKALRLRCARGRQWRRSLLLDSRWRARPLPEAQALAGSLPVEEPLDLVDGYARPLCLSLAAMVTGISRKDASGLCEMAQRVSAASAEPHDPALRAGAKSANAELRVRFTVDQCRCVTLDSLRSRRLYGLLVGKCVVRPGTTSEGMEIAASTRMMPIFAFSVSGLPFGWKWY